MSSFAKDVERENLTLRDEIRRQMAINQSLTLSHEVE